MAIFKQGRISTKDATILLILLAIILFLPLITLYFFENSWGELFWQNPTDIAMLEWTGAFLNMFLFLLIFENYRTTGKILFNFIACGFLSMGILNFIYAINSPGTETALWLRTFSIITGSIFFLFSIPMRKKESFDVAGAIIKYVIPTILISALAGWIPFSLKQILPRLITPKGDVSIFGSILFLIPCACFFSTAVIWLHKYIKDKKRVDLLIAVTIFILAQMTLLMRNANVWGVLWWLWHIVWILDVLFACIYMLILSVTRSIVWKLVFSLGLAFAMTVIIASGIIQSHSSKLALVNYRRQLHERHKKLLMTNDINFKCADIIMKKMVSDASAFCQKNSSSKYLFNAWLESYFKDRRKEAMVVPLEYGFYSYTDQHITTKTHLQLNHNQRDILKRSYIKFISSTKNISWSPFYYLPGKQRWYTYALQTFHKDGIDGAFFINVDVTKIITSSLIKQKEPHFSKTIVFSMTTGKILYAALSQKDLLKIRGVDFEKQIQNPFIRKLTATAFSLKGNGKIISASAGGTKFFISAQGITPPGWGVIKIINVDQFPVIKPESRYFLIAVGMITLLCGFVVLLILLHRQLSKPFTRLLSATEKLEQGDFDIRLKSKDESEIGAISRAFNHMAMTLKGLYSDLATTINERTQALEDARKADSAKVTFFQNVSHELRTPLHGILSYARLGKTLKPTESPQKVEKYFKNINESGERLMGMLDSILDLAKLESGNIPFNFRPVNINLILLKVKEELDATFLEKKVDLVIEKNQEDMTAEIDSEMIARVFRNLIGNALKMSPPGSAITIELKKKEDYITVSVLDEGPGIPKEEFNNIFDKFIQVGEGKRKGGTGLGLPICREIIHAHNGQIIAKNRIEGGACFTFNLPIHREKKNDKKKR
jgi:signal transduction histidine kinase